MKVTVDLLVEQLETAKGDILKDKTLTPEQRVKLLTHLIDRQLRAGALNLAYKKAVARLPEGADALVVPLLADTERHTASPSH